jgi:hypothetical protein
VPSLSRYRAGPDPYRFGVRLGRALAAILCAAQLSGCASMAQSAASDFAANLSAAILNQDDPELVGDSLPAYLVILDSLAAAPDASGDVLGAAARLYAAYAVVFVTDPDRSANLAAHAHDYGVRALCADRRQPGCGIDKLPYADLDLQLGKAGSDDASVLLSYVIGSLAYIRTHGEDWEALAGLPRIESVLNRLLVISPDRDAALVNTYLGVLNTLRPAALGGQPERGQMFFERALELTGRRDLGVLVDYARGYARLVYDRELHDRLLNETLQADPRQPGYTLFNILAQRQAAGLLASADDYF